MLISKLLLGCFLLAGQQVMRAVVVVVLDTKFQKTAEKPVLTYVCLVPIQTY